MQTLKKSSLILLLLLCNPVPAQAGILSWFMELFSGGTQTIQQEMEQTFQASAVGTQTAEPQTQNAEQPEAQMGWWQWIRYRFGWIRQEDLDRTEEELKGNTEQKFNETTQQFQQDLEPLSAKVDEAKNKVNDTVSEVEGARTQLEAAMEAEKKEREKENERQNNERNAKLEELKLKLQHEIEQKERELQELKNQQGTLTNQINESHDNLQSAVSQLRTTQKEQSAVVGKELTGVRTQVSQLEKAAKKTFGDFAKLTAQVPTVLQRFKVMGQNQAQQQEYLELFIQQFCGVTQEHNDFMKLMFGLHTKFGAALQLLLTQGSLIDVNVQNLLKMHTKIQTLMGSVVIENTQLPFGLLLPSSASAQALALPKPMRHQAPRDRRTALRVFYEGTMLQTNRLLSRQDQQLRQFMYQRKRSKRLAITDSKNAKG